MFLFPTWSLSTFSRQLWTSYEALTKKIDRSQNKYKITNNNTNNNSNNICKLPIEKIKLIKNNYKINKKITITIWISVSCQSCWKLVVSGWRRIRLVDCFTDRRAILFHLNYHGLLSPWVELLELRSASCTVGYSSVYSQREERKTRRVGDKVCMRVSAFVCMCWSVLVRASGARGTATGWHYLR